GKFPLWMAPEQARIMNITDEQADYCETVYQTLRAAGIRVEKDLRNEKLNYKIREAQLMKVPYMLIIGTREMEEGKITVRMSDGQNLDPMSPAEFAQLVDKEVRANRG
ncbi:MAG: His/Gly/Thr/Pro-type tRNA ligase C-terminal domain-containing protein, partial [Desulfobulbaceae bacterium]|nr:His/Gly/Thr/Pro-type tRNA ligase C-terminal domain-containing protein [Desulfobulbaceae bacterium]